MDLRALRHVVALARHLNYREAAEDLGLSQSALSRSIQALERGAGVRLFDRDRSGVRPTTVGRAFVDHASALLRQADDLDRLFRRHADGSAGEIAFGMAPVMAAALGPFVLGETLAETPDLDAHVLVRGADALFPRLIADEIEFVVCGEGAAPEDAPVKGAFLGRFPTSLLVRPGHPLLSVEQPCEGKTYPWITSAGFSERRRAQESPPWLGARPQLVFEDLGVLLKITEGGDAIWISSAFALGDEIAQGRVIPLPRRLWPKAHPLRSFKVMMYSLDRRTLSPAAMRMKERFHSRIRQLTALHMAGEEQDA